MRADKSRLKRDIQHNATFGAIETDNGRGRTVATGTEANRAARDYLVERMEEAGLNVRVDPVGNIAGRWTPTGIEPDVAPVASGSHLDSVPAGGIFDGPLGVYAALEAVRVLKESNRSVDRPIEVVCFTEEEGGRFDTLTGSSVASGRRPADELLHVTDESGIRLGNALAEIGYQGEATVDAKEWNSWLELHVEQGTRLENQGIPVGIVSAITGITQIAVEIHGEANHAGTTPMLERHDALTAAAEVVLELEQAAKGMARERSETAVGTVGRMNVRPNGTNVVPGEVVLGVDIRDISREPMELLVHRLREALARVEAERPVETSLDRHFDRKPTPLSERCRQAVRTAGRETEIATLDLHSGAGHDTMEVASVTDGGMLFAPSRDGVSHNPLEWTDWEDCAAATTVLTRAIANLATD
jgi:N-carbamoyl-L-amino-acid hydrolase